MKNSEKQRAAVRKARIKYNQEHGNPFCDPEIQRRNSMKVWGNAKKRAEVLRKRAERGYRPAPWLKNYHNIAEKRRELREVANKVGVPLGDTKSIDIETMEKAYEALKKLPD